MDIIYNPLLFHIFNVASEVRFSRTKYFIFKLLLRSEYKKLFEILIAVNRFRSRIILYSVKA